MTVENAKLAAKWRVPVTCPHFCALNQVLKRIRDRAQKVPGREGRSGA